MGIENVVSDFTATLLEQNSSIGFPLGPWPTYFSDSWPLEHCQTQGS